MLDATHRRGATVPHGAFAVTCWGRTGAGRSAARHLAAGALLMGCLGGAAACAGHDSTVTSQGATPPPVAAEPSAPSGGLAATDPAGTSSLLTESQGPTQTLMGDPSASLTPADPDSVVWVGSGKFTTIPVDFEAAPAEKTKRLAFQVEDHIDVDGDEFAQFVLTTLNDDRSWREEGYRFVADSDNSQVTVMLASPETSAALCQPLRTGGKLSCRNGSRVIFTSYRWAVGHQDYGDDLLGYRQYLVNHEVGHFLGKGHVGCPGAGQKAPVMMQQTKGLLGCAPNPWPYPQ